MAQGYSNCAIAERLVLQLKTVENHINVIYQTLNLSHNESVFHEYVPSLITSITFHESTISGTAWPLGDQIQSLHWPRKLLGSPLRIFNRRHSGSNRLSGDLDGSRGRTFRVSRTTLWHHNDDPIRMIPQGLSRYERRCNNGLVYSHWSKWKPEGRTKSM